MTLNCSMYSRSHVPSRLEGIETLKTSTSVSLKVILCSHVPSRLEGIETYVCLAIWVTRFEVHTYLPVWRELKLVQEGFQGWKLVSFQWFTRTFPFGGN